MNYMKILPYDVADGPGIRVAIYVSGCNSHCIGCHNPESWNFNSGVIFTDNTIDGITNLLSKSYISGLSILGGEPLDPQNQAVVLKLVLAAKKAEPIKKIWVWTGYEYEELTSSMPNTVLTEILKNIDVAVVGRFDINKRDITKENLWRGSTNQRVIDVQASLNSGKTVPLANIPNNEV